MVMCIIYMYTQYTLCIVCVHICNVNTYIYILCALEILFYATFMHGPSRYTHSIRGIIYRHRYMVEPLDAPEPLDADMPSRGRGRTVRRRRRWSRRGRTGNITETRGGKQIEEKD